VGRRRGPEEARAALAMSIYGDVLRRLATVAAADAEGDREPARRMAAWMAELEPRTDALIMIAVTLAAHAQYTPDALRGWAAMTEPRRALGWRT